MASNHRFFIFFALILLLATAVNSATLYKRSPSRLYHTSYMGEVSHNDSYNGTLVTRDTCTGCPAGTNWCTATECYGCPSGDYLCPSGNGCCQNGVTCDETNGLCDASCTGYYTLCGNGCCDQGYACDTNSYTCIQNPYV